MFSYIVEIRRLAPSSAEEGYPEKESIPETGLLVEGRVRHRYCTPSTTSVGVLEGDGAPRNTVYLMASCSIERTRCIEIRQPGFASGDRGPVDLNEANALYLSVYPSHALPRGLYYCAHPDPGLDLCVRPYHHHCAPFVAAT
jgi:hypothetical protein